MSYADQVDLTDEMVRQLEIARQALQCYADDNGWCEGYYDCAGAKPPQEHLINEFIGLDAKHLAGKALFMMSEIE